MAERGSSGEAPDGVVEDAVGWSGCRPGRVEVGGRYRADHGGVAAGGRDDLADELEPRHGSGVGEVMDAASSFEGDLTKGDREVGGEGGVADLIVDEAEVVAFADEAEHGGDHVVAVFSAYPRGAHGRGAAAEGGGFGLSGEFRSAVGAGRVDAVPFAVGTVEGSVEDVVGADLHEVAAVGVDGFGEPSDGEAVDEVGPLLLGFTGVDAGVGSAVDDSVRSGLGDGGVHTGSVGDVEPVATSGDDLVAGFGADARDVASELSLGAGDEYPHQVLALSGSHQSRCSRYHSTVSASPVSKSRVRLQPRAVSRSMSTE